jgi:hypothetical protein
MIYQLFCSCNVFTFMNMGNMDKSYLLNNFNQCFSKLAQNLPY